MMNAQVTTSASGTAAESGLSGVTKGQGKKGGLFAVLMKAFQSHLKAGMTGKGITGVGLTGTDLTGASGDAKMQGKDILASLLQGKHGKEISALLAKLAKGGITSDAKLLDSLSSQALAALKLALSQNVPMKSADGSVDLAAKIKAALQALSTDNAKVVSKNAASNKPKPKVEDGSSLQVGVAIAGVHIVQSKLTTGGLKQQQEAAINEAATNEAATNEAATNEAATNEAATNEAATNEAATNGVAEDLVAKGKGTKLSSGKIGSVGRSTSGQVSTAQTATAQTATAQTATAQTATAQAATAQTATAQAATAQAATAQTATAQTATAQTATAQTATVPTAIEHKASIPNGGAANVVSTTPFAATEYRDGVVSQHGINNNILSAVANGKPASSVVSSTLLADNSATQGDGLLAAQFRPVVSPTLTPTGNSDLVAAKVAHQALATAQGNQHNSGGDSASQQGDKSPQSGFETLLAGQRNEARAATQRADFLLPSGYKSATTWKPAQAMMQIGRAAADGSIRLDLQLEPAHLGKVTVSIQSDATKKVQLHITVDNAAGRVALDQNMGQLRQALMQQGLDLGSFSMNLSSQGQPNQQQDGRQSSFSSAQGTSFRLQTDGIQEENVAMIGTNRAEAGRLSILA